MNESLVVCRTGGAPYVGIIVNGGHGRKSKQLVRKLYPPLPPGSYNRERWLAWDELTVIKHTDTNGGIPAKADVKGLSYAKQIELTLEFQKKPILALERFLSKGGEGNEGKQRWPRSTDPAKAV